MEKKEEKKIVLHITSSLLTGGAEKLLAELLINFKIHPKNQFEHQVIYFQSGALKNQIKNAGFKTYHVTGFFWYYDLICFFKLYKLIKKIKPNVIHSMLWSANFYTRIIGKLLNIPVICAIHSHHNSGNYHYDNYLKLKLDQLTLNLASHIITVSPSIKKKLTGQQYQIPTSKISTIHNGITLLSCSSNIAKQKAIIFTIGHVGRLVPVKNQALLIHALKIVSTQIPNFKTIIIGSGILELKLKQLVCDLDLDSKIDFIKTNQTHQYYPRLDCFVLPSHQEGQSMALLEAMSFGVTPIITSISNQKKHEIIKHLQNGLICQANAEDLAQAIIKLGQNNKLNQKLGAAAYQTIATKFNLHHTATLYLKTYQKIHLKTRS
jgi:glycosyltransferase involved in cell wall biosynthesis